jgi:hypothetical protein
MRTGMGLQVLALCAVSVAVAGLGSAQQSHMTKRPMPYSKVASLIKVECASCHNAKSHPEKVDLSTYQSLMKSGEHGPIVIAGHPEKSKLIMYVDGEKQPRMPFKQPPMSNAKIQLLKAWIAAGAKG